MISLKLKRICACQLAFILGLFLNAAFGAEQSREIKEFGMVELKAYLNAFKKPDPFHSWIAQLRNITMLTNDCRAKAMAIAFRDAMQSTRFETFEDRIDMFKKSFPSITTAHNNGTFQCIIEIFDPNNVKSKNFVSFNDGYGELEIVSSPTKKFSDPYGEHVYFAENAFGTSATVRKYSLDEEIFSIVLDEPKFDARIERPISGEIKLRLKMDRKSAGKRSETIYIYALVDIAAPFYEIGETTTKPTFSEPSEVTFHEYTIFVKPVKLIVSDFFPGNYLRIFDIAKCRRDTSYRITVSEATCK